MAWRWKVDEVPVCVGLSGAQFHSVLCSTCAAHSTSFLREASQYTLHRMQGTAHRHGPTYSESALSSFCRQEGLGVLPRFCPEECPQTVPCSPEDCAWVVMSAGPVRPANVGHHRRQRHSHSHSRRRRCRHTSIELQRPTRTHAHSSAARTLPQTMSPPYIHPSTQYGNPAWRGRNFCTLPMLE